MTGLTLQGELGNKIITVLYDNLIHHFGRRFNHHKMKECSLDMDNEEV